MSTDTRYTVTVTREDGHWVAHAVDLGDGNSTYARNLRTLDARIRQVIVLGADLPDEAIADLDIDYRYQTGVDAPVDLDAARLRALRAELTAETARLARAYRHDAGLSVRDTAHLLGISPARAQQLAPGGRRGRPPTNPAHRPHHRPGENPMTSGYTPCACRDCFDVSISSEDTKPELCLLCKDAGCQASNGECQRADAYGGAEEDSPTEEPTAHAGTTWEGPNNLGCCQDRDSHGGPGCTWPGVRTQ